MKNAKIAVEISDGAYYNMPLSDILGINALPKIPLGNAAAEMLENKKPKPLGFFAFGDSQHQFGLRFNGARADTEMWAEISHFAEENTFMGADFGALGAAAAKTTGAKIGVRRPLSGEFSAFGEYGYGGVQAKTGGYIASVENAKTEEWAAGISYANLIRKNDSLRFSVRRAETIGGGEMVLRLPSAAGGFYESFLGGAPQELEIAEHRIPLKRRAPLIWTAGYSAKTENGEWALAAEYAENGKGKLSAKWRVELR